LAWQSEPFPRELFPHAWRGHPIFRISMSLNQTPQTGRLFQGFLE
jgi:hypothetical protein